MFIVCLFHLSGGLIFHWRYWYFIVWEYMNMINYYNKNWYESSNVLQPWKMERVCWKENPLTMLYSCWKIPNKLVRNLWLYVNSSLSDFTSFQVFFNLVVVLLAVICWITLFSSFSFYITLCLLFLKMQKKKKNTNLNMVQKSRTSISFNVFFLITIKAIIFMIG